MNPRYRSNNLTGTRFALILGLLLSGAFGLGTAIYIKPKSSAATAAAISSPSIQVPVVVSHQPAVAVAKEMPEPSPAPARNSDDLIAFCSKNVTTSRSFVVFRYGTCVIVDEPCLDPVKEARRILKANEDPEARFVPELTQEGDLIVSFKEPIFHNFSESERDAILGDLDRLTPALLTPRERVSAGDGWVPPTHARYGLLARRRMLEDAAKPVPVKVIRASQVAMNGH